MKNNYTTFREDVIMSNFFNEDVNPIDSPVEPIPEEDLSDLLEKKTSYIKKQKNPIIRLNNSFKKEYLRYSGFFRITGKFIGLLARLVAGTIVLRFMGDLAPGLMHSMPNFFRIVSSVNELFDKMCSVLVPYIGTF